MIARLKELRNEKGLTQKEIAEYLNITQQTYSDYETGRTNPDIDTLILISVILETSIDYLLGREDDFGNITITTAPAALRLSEREQNLLDVYRKLDTVNKMHVSAYAEVRLEEQEKSSFSKVRKK